MQIRTIIAAMLCAMSGLAIANTTPQVDTFRYGFGTERLFQLGVRLHHAVRMELEMPVAEFLLQPIEYFSVGVRIGSVRTKKLPELFMGERGRMTGLVFRINIPLEGKLDLYGEFVKAQGDLSFNQTVYGLADSELSDNFRPSTSLSGKVAFRQNRFQFGLRQHFYRYFFIDASFGWVNETFILEAEGVQNTRAATAYLFDFTNELLPNEWHDNLAPRAGISVGLRF